MRTLISNIVFHHSQRSVTIACLFFILIIFKSSSPSSLPLLRGLRIFLVPSIVAFAIVLAFVGFAFFQPVHTVLVGGIL